MAGGPDDAGNSELDAIDLDDLESGDFNFSWPWMLGKGATSRSQMSPRGRRELVVLNLLTWWIFELDLELMASGKTSPGRPPFGPDFACPLGVLRNVLRNPPLVA